MSRINRLRTTKQKKKIIHLKTKSQQKPSTIKGRGKGWGDSEQGQREQWDKLEQPKKHTWNWNPSRRGGWEKGFEEIMLETFFVCKL